MKSKIKYIVILFISFFLLSSNVFGYYDKVDNTEDKIYDFGEYLTQEEKENLKIKIDKYISTYNLDLVIVTKKDYPYSSMRSYAEDFYDYNNFGIGNTHDGIILFFNIDSEGPCVYIVTTGEAIRIYDDQRIDSLKTRMSNQKSNGNYRMIDAFIDALDSYASMGVAPSNKDTYIDKNGDLKVVRHYPFSIIFYSLLFTFIIMIILIKKNKILKKAYDANNYFDKSEYQILIHDIVHTNSSVRKIVHQSSSSSHSGRTGGSSVHVGSSGTSHGGGGGRL